MRQKIHFCRAPDGVNLAYATSGEGPPLVRVANWVTHLELDWEGPIWPYWFEELSQNHTLVRYDMRGCGLSDRNVSELSLEAWVSDLETVVDDLGLEQFSLFGFCQGGSIAVAYAARNPERVHRLVLYDSYSHGSLVDGEGIFERAKTEALTQMIKVGWGRQNAAFRKVFVDLLVPEGSEEQQQWLAELQRQSTSPEMAARMWQTFHKLDVRDLAPQVETPTLVFHVKNDAMIPFKMGCRLASLISDARFVPLMGNNHILLPDEPAWNRFLAELHSFLEAGTSEDGFVEPEEVFPELTPREHEVLELIAKGLTNDEIAERLYISPKTVRNHITHIFSKLQVESRAKAIVLAREAGMAKE